MGSVWTKSIVSSVCVPLVSARHLPLCSSKTPSQLTTGAGEGSECVWAEHEEVIKVATWEETLWMLRWGTVSASMSSKSFVA